MIKIDCLKIRNNILADLPEIKGEAIFIQVGDRPDSTAYINNKKKLCDKYNIKYKHIQKRESITETELIDLIVKYNYDDNVAGIMVQLPLPIHINEQAVIDAIDPVKDIDGFTHENKGKLMVGDRSAIVPCTPLGIMCILQAIKFNPRGKNVVIAGRSNIVGKPMTQLLINFGATVTCCNSSTPDEKLKELILNSDLFISAIDKPWYFDIEYFGRENLELLKNTIAIDVGIVKVEDKLKGNIDTELYDYFQAITPVPGGVGPMTVACVLTNIAKCEKIQNENK